jgi:antitoxin component of MazEF toxin-antitoxin module
MMADNGIRIVKLGRRGNSDGITICAEFMRALGIARGARVRLDLIEDYIVVRRNDEKPIKLKHAPPTLGPGRILERR